MLSWLALSLTVLAAAPQGQDPIVNRALYDKGVEHLDSGRFEEASALFGELYKRTGDPWALYNRAQAERLNGDCAAALPLYRAFLATEELDERDRYQATKNIERCGGDASGPPPVPLGVDPSAPEAGTDGTITEPAPPEKPTRKERRARKKSKRAADAPLPPPPRLPSNPVADEPNLLDDTPRSNEIVRDPVGWSLAGTGLVAIAVGAPLYALGNRDANTSSDGLNESEYVDRVEDGRRQRVAGAVLIAAGSALVTGAAVRFIHLALKKKRGDSLALRF